MEKYSAFRDPGTGIQPFLSPVPPQGSMTLAYILSPIKLLFGVVRTFLVLCLCLLYVVIVEGICYVFIPVSYVHQKITSALTAIFARLILLSVGMWWIPVERVTKQRGRGDIENHWNPKAGDVIVSNWISWVEVLWLAFRFNPVFVLPITEPIESPPTPRASGKTTPSTSRRTGTGHTNISVTSASQTSIKRSRILGFTQVSLFSMIRATGRVPPYGLANNVPQSFDKIRKEARRPIAVLPECTTSNGRGLLRFADVFQGEAVPVTKYRVFVMCVRIDPPTTLSPTLSQSIPALPVFLNPIPHLFTVSCSLVPHNISIRILAPQDSPSSGSFLPSSTIAGNYGADVLSEACATLIASIGRMKRTGMGWEDKTNFLEFYKEKRK